MIRSINSYYSSVARFLLNHPIAIASAIGAISALGIFRRLLFQRSSIIPSSSRQQKTPLDKLATATCVTNNENLAKLEAQRAAIMPSQAFSNPTNKTCVLAELNGEESIEIPSDMVITLGNNCYHIRNLVLALLSMSSLKDPLTNIPLTEKEIAQLADRLGMKPKALKEIWENVSERSEERVEERVNHLRPSVSSSHPLERMLDDVVFTVQRSNLEMGYLLNASDYHTDERFRNLFDMLTNQTAFTSRSDQLKKRSAFLGILEENKVWADKFVRKTPPKSS